MKKITIILLLFSTFTLAQVSDSVYQFWADKQTWQFDERIFNSYNSWHVEQHIEASMPIPLADPMLDGYRIFYTFIIDTTELLRTDNLIYRPVLVEPQRIDTLAFHPILDDGYASFWQRDRAGKIMLVRKYIKLIK